MVFIRVPSREKGEIGVMVISFWSGVIFALAEFFMAVYSDSQSIMADTVYDAIELVLIGITIFIIPLFYKPLNEKRPFGYSQFESLLILLKGMMFLSVMMVIIANNIQIMMKGGNSIDHMQVSVFELILTILSLGILLMMVHINKKVTSPLIEAEISGWKIDVITGLGVSLAFYISTLFVSTPLEWLIPYFDQIVAIILCLCMLPEPLKMIEESFRSLFLFSPGEDIIEDIKQRTGKILDSYPFNPVFYDITTTGRRLWISIYFTPQHDLMSFTELEVADALLKKELQKEYPDCFVELIPDVEENV